MRSCGPLPARRCGEQWNRKRGLWRGGPLPARRCSEQQNRKRGLRRSGPLPVRLFGKQFCNTIALEPKWIQNCKMKSLASEQREHENTTPKGRLQQTRSTNLNPEPQRRDHTRTPPPPIQASLPHYFGITYNSFRFHSEFTMNSL